MLKIQEILTFLFLNNQFNRMAKNAVQQYKE